MTAPELAVGAVVLAEDEILLVRRGTEPERGQWSVPGGRVERGESVVEAVVRELREETGLDGVVSELLGWVERIGDDHHFVILDFRVVLLDRADPVAGDDAVDVRWVDRWSVTDLDLVDGLASALAEWGVIDAIADDDGVSSPPTPR